MLCNKVTLFFTPILLSFYSNCHGAYNIAELENVIYDLEIAEIPMGFENFELDEVATTSMSLMLENVPQMKNFNVDDGRSVIVASEFGQKFLCSLPKIPEQKLRNESKLNLTINLISDVLAASFYVQNCIRRSTGWWTYELCYNKHVQQFHLEGSKIVGNVITLGYYSNDSALNVSKHKIEKLPYFEQIYDDGTTCDVTEKPRLTRVWYMCDDALSTSEAYIGDVDEPSSCEYIIKVKTGSLCKLDAFLSDSKPHEPLAIMCRPLLEQEAADEYFQKMIKEQQLKEEAKKKSELLATRAESIQRQRYARKRLALRTPEGIKEAELAEKELKLAYEDMMRSITKLNFDFTKVKADLHFIYDDLHEMETHYKTEADEDLANIFWYFKDPYWDRKFFPITLSYSRAINSFYSVMTKFLKKFDEEYDDKKISFNKFLQNIEDGLITESHLSMMIGSLRKAFHEGIFPDIVNDLDDPENPVLRKMWTDAEQQLELLQLFEYKVLKLLNRKIKFDPEDLMSHVARQMLSIRALINSGNSYGIARKISYIVLENLFLKFAQSYNRAVLRFDRNSWGNFLKRDPTEAFRLFAKPNMFITRVEDLKPENVHLFYVEGDKTKIEEENDVTEINLNEDEKELQRKLKEEEKAARLRIHKKAKRKNLRKKVEHYLRSQKTMKKVKTDEDFISDDFDGLRKQLLAFKNTLEEKIRETGLIQGAEVKVQLVSPFGNIISGSGIAGMDDERINTMLKTFFLEQDSVTVEENRYDRLARGYTYGADEVEREKILQNNNNDDDGDDDLKSSILPILKRILP